MGVSENSGFSPQIIHFYRVFHIKAIHFGVPLFLETPKWAMKKNLTLQGINISHLAEKENHLQTWHLSGDMLVPRRVLLSILLVMVNRDPFKMVYYNPYITLYNWVVSYIPHIPEITRFFSLLKWWTLPSKSPRHPNTCWEGCHSFGRKIHLYKMPNLMEVFAWMSRGRLALESRRNSPNSSKSWDQQKMTRRSKFLWYFYTSQHENISFFV